MLMALVVVVVVFVLLIVSPPEPIPVLEIELGDVEDNSGVEIRLSFDFKSLLVILFGSPTALLVADESPPSLLLELPILGREGFGWVVVVDAVVVEGGDETLDVVEVDDTEVVALNTWVTLSITLPLRMLPIVLAWFVVALTLDE